MALGPMLTDVLARYGLQGLAEWMSDKITSGASEAEITLELYDRPEFKQRFPAIFQRQNAGMSPITPEEYIQYEGFARATANQFGVNVTQDEINASIAGDVSVKEMEDRLGIAAQVVYRSPQEVRDNLTRMFDLTTGDMIRYWLDPKQELPSLQKRFFSAQISAESQLAGIGQLSAEQAGRLVDRGLTGENAQDALQKIGRSGELFAATDQTETDLGLEGKLAALVGDPEVTTELERRAQRRRSPFESGGGFATGRAGVAGLGSATR